MLPIIIISIIAIAIVIALYQLLIQKHYWGPQGPPEKRKQERDTREK
jgi:uncharacterized phage infection (PIP) family protein YhgE